MDIGKDPVSVMSSLWSKIEGIVSEEAFSGRVELVSGVRLLLGLNGFGCLWRLEFEMPQWEDELII